MHVLLDEHRPKKLKWRLKERLPEDDEILTVPERGWNGRQNGDLLRATETEFDVLVTMDSDFEYQQEIRGVQLGIVLLKAPSTKYQDLLPLVEKTTRAIHQVGHGQILHVAL